MIHAKKIDIDFSSIDVNNLKLTPFRGHVVFESRVGVDRFNVEKSVENQIKTLIPQKLKNFIISVNLTFIQEAIPHRHNIDHSVINYYFDTDEYETIFYEGPVKKESFVSNDFGNAYFEADLNEITPVEKFIAKSGDTYILNTRTTHSVSHVLNQSSDYNKFRPLVPGKRRALQIWTMCPFEIICNMF
jgi:hypothetical protein